MSRAACRARRPPPGPLANRRVLAENRAARGAFPVLNAPSRLPLVCDLDETLICSDSFRGALRYLALKKPAALLAALPALARGWPAFKCAVAARVAMREVRPAFNARVLAYLRAEAEAGRRVVLCTATPQVWADEIAAELPGLFSEVIGSAPGRNLKGRRKTERLVALFGEGGFDYAGDSLPDLRVWRAAAGAIFAGHRNAVRRRLRKIKPGFLDLSAGAASRGGAGAA